MPPQNAVELVPTKSGSETPKNGNMNNNNKENALPKLDLSKVPEEPEPTKATIVIPPDGGFGWIVMVRRTNFNIILNLTPTFFITACKFLLQRRRRRYRIQFRIFH